MGWVGHGGGAGPGGGWPDLTRKSLRLNLTRLNVSSSLQEGGYI